MKTILLLFLLLANINSPAIIADGNETEIELRNQNENNEIDRSCQFAAFYYPESATVEIYASGISQYNVTIEDFNQQVIVRETSCSSTIMRLPVSTTQGTYSLFIDGGSMHLVGQFVVQ